VVARPSLSRRPTSSARQPSWELGGKSVEPNRNLAHIEQLAAAKQAGIPVFVSEQASMPQRLPSAPIWVMGLRPRPTRFVAGAVLTTVQAFAA
jgi:hypothetical protein